MRRIRDSSLHYPSFPIIRFLLQNVTYVEVLALDPRHEKKRVLGTAGEELPSRGNGGHKSRERAGWT